MMSQQVHPALANETDDTTVQVHYLPITTRRYDATADFQVMLYNVA